LYDELKGTPFDFIKREKLRSLCMMLDDTIQNAKSELRRK
jgi:hypothetical protein